MLKINLLGQVTLRICGFSMLHDYEQHKIHLMAKDILIGYADYGVFVAKSSSDLYKFIKKLNDKYTILLL